MAVAHNGPLGAGTTPLGAGITVRGQNGTIGDQINIAGTQVLVADRPLGPYRPHSRGAVTRMDYDAAGRVSLCVPEHEVPLGTKLL